MRFQRRIFAVGGGALLAVAVVSGAINILTLSGSIFMLEVYDRVLPSHSVPTLTGLAIALTVMYAFQWFFDTIRGRILVRLGGAFDEDLASRVFQALLRAPLRGKVDGDGQQPQRDLDQVRTFLAGGGPSALFDLPWMPLYVIICFGFHPWIGITALVGALILVSLTLATELLTREASKVAIQAALVRNGIYDAGRRNAEVVQAMGMTRRLDDQWTKANTKYITFQRRTSDVAGGLGAASKILRMLLQSAVLAVGAYLVIEGKATGGIMIAASILVSRALAPVELAIANWKGFVGARQGWARLTEILEAMDSEPDRMRLPAPVAELSVEAASAGAPGGRVFLIHEVRFKLTAGCGVGIIGPSGSGKSSLAKMLVGVWPTWRGKIRLDGAALEQWDSDELGRHVGYLPQDVELFGGTVEQNIARFDPDAEPNAVIAAAKAADVHDLILRLPDGYKTEIGNGGATVSAGQRQRIALARALYSDPFLVVLDEPNSNLDSEGERALTFAIQGVRARGGIVVVIAHRPSALEAVDQVLVMREGHVEAFGQKEEVLNKVFRLAPGASDAPSRTSPNAPLKVVQA